MTSRYDSLFQFYAGRRGLDWKFLKAQAIQESNLIPTAYNKSGATGLCQFMPETFNEVAQNLGLLHPSLWNPEHQVACQAAMMADLLRRFGTTERALAAYDWGEGHVSRMPVWDTAQLPAETQDYIKRIIQLEKTL